MGFDAALPQFEALNAQVVGVSADHAATLEAFSKQQNLHHLLLSDFRRQMLPAYGALVTDEKSPIFRYAKRAYFVIDQKGVVRWVKIQENALDLLDPNEVLKALKDSGAGA
jgi:peroxiredoxin